MGCLNFKPIPSIDCCAWNPGGILGLPKVFVEQQSLALAEAMSRGAGGGPWQGQVTWFVFPLHDQSIEK